MPRTTRPKAAKPWPSGLRLPPKSSSGWSPTQIENSFVPVSGPDRAIDSVPSLCESPVTLVRSSVTIPLAFGTFTPGLDLEGQSPLLVNGSVSWRSANGGVNATMLYNHFSDRIVRYGYASGNVLQGPNLIERGRGTLDGKAQIAVGRGATVSLAARNLTNARVQFVQTVDIGDDITGRSVPGINFSVGVSIVR